MIIVLAFILGIIIGSFLNVVILRHNSGKTVGGRSMCFSCGKTLHAHELVPVFSYIIQRGRCSVCKSKISIQYPLVECLTGIVFALTAVMYSHLFFLSPFSFGVKFLYIGYLFSLLIVIAVYDARHKIIPNEFVYLFTIMSFVLMFFETGSVFSLHVPTLWQFLAGPLLALPFAAMWYFSGGRWMGFGDAKLALGMGFLLGLERGVSALLIAFWSGAIIGIILLILKRCGFTMKSEIPFAPFLVLGTLIAFYLNLHFFVLFL